MLLSIIVPVYNEERTVTEMLRRLLAASFPGYQKEIVVANDCSTDGTKKAIAPFVQKIIYCEHTKNLGKGAAVRTGFSRARGELIAIQDADLEYAPEQVGELLEALAAHPEWSAVYGSRNLASTGRGYGTYILGVWFLTKLVNLLFGATLTDVYTCHKLIRTDALRSLQLNSNGFEIEMEITARLLKNGKQIGEIPISYHPRTKAEGKKIRPKDGLRGLLTLLRCAAARRESVN